jgi:hypothetical protein
MTDTVYSIEHELFKILVITGVYKKTHTKWKEIECFFARMHDQATTGKQVINRLKCTKLKYFATAPTDQIYIQAKNRIRFLFWPTIKK